MNNHMSLATRLLFLFAVCFVLNACVTPKRAGPAGSPSPVKAAQRNAERGHYARAAELYAQAASQQPQPEKQNALRLDAAIAALHANRINKAEHQLTQVNPELFGPNDFRRYQFARTLVRIAPMAPEKALKQLPPPPGGLPPDLAAFIWKTRAELLFAQYKYVEGIHDLVQRSVWLLNDKAVRQNNQLIFKRALEAVKLGRGPDSPAARRAGSTTLGWLRLAEIKRNGPKQAGALKQTLNNWETRFTGHPATGGLLLSVFNYESYSNPSPRPSIRHGLSGGPIVLFLPLSGELAQPARALRTGFEVARSHSDTQKPLKVIDSTNLTAQELIQRARSAGASLIVGPLKKSKVASLAHTAPRIPVLALNQVAGINTPPWFYSYALAPEDDARTAAAYAARQGWTKALAIVPQGNWGRRVLNAFKTAFGKRHGRLLNYSTFDTNRYDHQQAIQSVLQTPGQGEPADFVFMAARPAHARLLRSQLRYFHAARLPVIATSDVYSGQPAPRKDTDLNGVAFAAVPWVIGSDRKAGNLRRQAMTQTGHAAEQSPRLVAMGIDAWRLTRQLARNGLKPGLTLQGLTGVLEVQPTGRIRRHLAWAHFVNGRARLVAPATAGQATTYRSNSTFSQPAVELKTGTSDNTPPQQLQGRSHSGGTSKQGQSRHQPTVQPSRKSPYGPVYSGEPASSGY